jgi:hypothetical protein
MKNMNKILQEVLQCRFAVMEVISVKKSLNDLVVL